MKYTANIDVPTERIHAMFVGAFEGGSTYWLNDAELIRGKRHSSPNLVWWAEQSLFAQDFEIRMTFDDPNGEASMHRSITPAEVAAGLTTMATKYPRHFADMLSENDDAITADVFMQCVVLGDTIYG